MLPSPRFVTAVFATLLLAAAPAGQTTALKGLDPVALCRGTELAGRPDVSTQRGDYTYLFATAANLDTFRAEPERYEIQMGGGCARMGPASGLGDVDRFHVHDGRIYIFASDQCREGFKKRPAAFLDADAARPEPGAEQRAEGERLRQRAIAAHGGLDRLRSWRTYRDAREVVQGTTTERFRRELLLPGQLRLEHDYVQGEKTWHYASAFTANDGFFVDQGKPRPMSLPAQRELRHRLWREPLVALRRSLDTDHVVVGRGKNTVAELDVEEFELWIAGCSTTFGADAEGRIRTARFRGRGPQLWFGDIVLVFDDFTTIAGLTVPQTVRGTMEGKVSDKLGEKRTVEIDIELTADKFVMPK